MNICTSIPIYITREIGKVLVIDVSSGHDRKFDIQHMAHILYNYAAQAYLTYTRKMQTAKRRLMELN